MHSTNSPPCPEQERVMCSLYDLLDACEDLLSLPDREPTDDAYEAFLGDVQGFLHVWGIAEQLLASMLRFSARVRERSELYRKRCKERESVLEEAPSAMQFLAPQSPREQPAAAPAEIRFREWL